MTNTVLLLPKDAPESLYKLLGDEIIKLQKNSGDSEGENPLVEQKQHGEFDT